MNKTIEIIRKELEKEGKSITVRSLYRYLLKIGIRPMGARQRPQIYPQDTTKHILQHLGILAQPAAPSTPAILPLKTLRNIKKQNNRRSTAKAL